MPREKQMSVEQPPFVTLLGNTRNDPAGFAELALRIPEWTDTYGRPRRLRKWQEDLCEEIRVRLARGERQLVVTVRSCHGAGKTFLGALLVNWFLFTRTDSRVLTTAPTWAGVEGLIWPEIKRLYLGSLLPSIPLGRCLTTRLDVSDTWFAIGASSDRPENLEGHHSPAAALRLVDEAKAVPVEVFDSTEGLLDAPESLDLWISTPALRSGRFYEREARGEEDVVRAVVTVDDLIADGIPGKAEWKARRLKEWGEQSAEYQSRAMASYIDQAEGALFPYSWIDRAMSAPFEVLGAPVAGFDVAGSKDGDESVVALAFGPDEEGRHAVTFAGRWKETDTMVSKGRALSLAREAGATVVRVDCIGLGKGVHDALAADVATEEYRASSRPADPTRFVNRKAEDLWHVRELLEKGQLRLPAMQDLKAQLLGMRYSINAAGKVQSVDPADSPDLVDALTIALAGHGSSPHAGFLAYMDRCLEERSKGEAPAPVSPGPIGACGIPMATAVHDMSEWGRAVSNAARQMSGWPR
jgi:hypothetical protein